MATQTLAEASRLINNDIVTGIAEEIITLDAFYDLVPFTPFSGQAMVVNYESTLGDSQFLNVGDTITAKNPMANLTRTFYPTTLIGDVEMNNLVQATSSGAGVDQLALEIASKAKKLGRDLQGGLATGDGTLPNMNSVRSLVDGTQTIYADGTGAAGGAGLSFELLDQLIDKVKAKDGVVDYILMSGSMYNSYKALIRAMGGNSLDDIVTIPTTANAQRTVIAYEGIPIFKNDFLSVLEGNDGTGAGVFQSIYAGVFDDGTRRIGGTFIYPEATAGGITTQMVGTSSTKDEEIYRLRFYGNFGLCNKLGLARLAGLTI